MTSISERDRRWKLLHAAMSASGYDALIFAANDYRGHKGSLRYVADYNLAHRYGYAVMFAGEEPIVVLPQNLGGGRRPRISWVSDYRYPHHLPTGLAEVLTTRKKHISRIGVVGLNQVMKVEDYLVLRDSLSGVTIEDASALFERVRAVKSAEEIRGAEESAYITDQCFERLLNITRTGMTEREAAAEMYRIAAKLGAEDPLFLTMYADHASLRPHPTFGVPRDRVLTPRDVFTFSFELVGPTGYWVELSRMIVFARPEQAVSRIATAVGAGMTAGRVALQPGTSMARVQEEVIAAVEAEGVKSSYWSGHGLGLDVLEEPWIGLDVVQDSNEAGAVSTAEAGMVLAMHPMLWDDTAAVMGYMADTYVVEDDGARSLSRFPVDLYQVPTGA